MNDKKIVRLNIVSVFINLCLNILAFKVFLTLPQDEAITIMKVVQGLYIFRMVVAFELGATKERMAVDALILAVLWIGTTLNSIF